MVTDQKKHINVGTRSIVVKASFKWTSIFGSISENRRGLQIIALKLFSYFSTKTYVLGSEKNRLAFNYSELKALSPLVNNCSLQPYDTARHV